MAEVDSFPTRSTTARACAAPRCSIIVFAGNDSCKLDAYLRYLGWLRLPDNYELLIVSGRGLELNKECLKVTVPTLKVLHVDGPLNQEQFFDRAAMAAKGKYLLYVRNLIPFDKTILEESIKDLEASREKVSISANKTFVLVERSHFASLGGFRALFDSLGLRVEQAYAEKNRNFKDKKATVLLVVCLFENNFGDILIYETINKKLKDAGFETELVEVSQSLNESGLIEKANNSDFLYFVGGGIIERWAPQIIKHFDSLYKHIQVPYGVVGLSTGEFDYAGFNNSLKLFCEKAKFFYTRDEESAETFRKTGACKLPTAGVDVTFANDMLTQLERTGDVVTASFRNIPYIDITGDLNWKLWSDALRKIGVKSLIHDCHNAQSKLGIPVDNSDILQQISHANIIVVMRFHIIIAASMIGVLTIPINYCPKVKRLAEQLGIEEYCLELNDHDKLESTFQRLKSNEKTVRKNMDTRVSGLKARANEIIKNSIRIMEKSINEN